MEFVKTITIGGIVAISIFVLSRNDVRKINDNIMAIINKLLNIKINKINSVEESENYKNEILNKFKRLEIENQMLHTNILSTNSENSRLNTIITDTINTNTKLISENNKLLEKIKLLESQIKSN